MRLRRVATLVVLLCVTAGVLYGLSIRVGGMPPVSTMLDPADGLYRTARTAPRPADTTQVSLPGLNAPVTVLWDRRHVPHIFAPSDRAATMALGYVVAQDRLFQLDFLPRVASGRLAAAIGPQAVSTDRFLRRTGMEWGARKNLERIRSADGIEHDALRWYSQGVNAYLDTVAPSDLPLEFRLLGYEPDRFSPLQGLRLLQYMSFDLTYNTDDPSYARLQRALSDSVYRTLYPEYPAGLYEPMIPPEDQVGRGTSKAMTDAGHQENLFRGARAALKARHQGQQALAALTGIQPHPSKGSNNWAVQGARSATGAPLLAGDMHLSLSLPSIWYEAHIVTPTTNAHGLTIPGAPVLIQAFNQNVGWALTNTGADQIDHYALELDSSRTRYRFEGGWRALRREVDTLEVNGAPPVRDTVWFSHHGPVHFSDTGGARAIAERWVGHKPSRILRALWQMNRADSLADVRRALRDWDTPMQNVLYAGTGGDIAIRAAGHLPVRQRGDGRGLLDGTVANRWVGRVPFDSLPASKNPRQKYLASANQVPTGPGYPYYLGHDWGDGYRSLRINTLLRGKSRHDVADFKAYQSDVRVQQQEVFVPYLRDVDGLSPRADTLRRMLQKWSGEATTELGAPLVMDVFLQTLRQLTWDEPVFAGVPDPEDAVLVDLMRQRPTSRWLDIVATDEDEDAPALLTHAMEAVADTLAVRHGWTPGEWRWGDHHKLRLDHLTGSAALRPLGRGPFEYPGFAATLSPARGRTVTHSASQRVIVDFSTQPPSGIGVYPGGQSGRPLDPQHYDAFVPAYLSFEYFDLQTPARPSALPSDARRAKLVLRPGG